MGPLYNERKKPIVNTGLDRVAQKARKEPGTRFTSLAHHLTTDMLLRNTRSISSGSAKGVDHESRDEAIENFDKWGPALIDQIHRRGYRPPPVRRVFIPKPGKDELRPLGVPTVKDRALQRSTAQVLEAIYEQDFLPFSFGGRPGRGAHKALAYLSHTIANQKVSWVYEADLKNFFGSLDHGWLEKFLNLRVGDPRLITLLQRWLKAGIMVENRHEDTVMGVPQGGSISVVLSNLYLHYVLDLWFDRIVRPRLKGEAYICRYLDDFVVCFQFKSDAKRFASALTQRLSKFGLALEPTKTRLVPFGRFSKRDSALEGFRKPPTLSFLGFTLFGQRYPWGYWGVGLKPQASRLRRFMAKLKESMGSCRHMPLRDQAKAINTRLRGFVNYFSLPLTSRHMTSLRRWTIRHWRKVLSSRSQSGRINWTKYNKILQFHPILPVKLRFTHQGWMALMAEQAKI